MTFTRQADFFVTAPNSVSFTTLINAINTMPDDASSTGRIQKGPSYAITLLDCVDHADYACGRIARYRTDDMPGCGKAENRSIRSLPIPSDEGIVDTTYFHFDKELNILCLLSGKSGVKWGTFEHYIRDKSGERQFRLLPLLNARTMRIFRRLHYFTALTVAMAPANGTAPQSQQVKRMGVKDMLKTGREELNAGDIVVEFRQKRRLGGLIKEKLSELVTGLLDMGHGSNDSTVQSLKVKGRENANSKDIVLDLIEQRYRLGVTLNGSERVLEMNETRRKMTQLFDEHRSELVELTHE
jgi:hypothetical protein